MFSVITSNIIWYKSYLSFREIYINNVKSNMFELVIRLLQGSDFDPLPILLCINYLPVKANCTILYVDVTSIAVSANRPTPVLHTTRP